MGPRHFSRGSERRRYQSRIESLRLQWGHGISAVEVTKEQAILDALIELQWGHGISAVEVGRRGCDGLNRQVASMGPRHFSRGSN